MHGDGHVDHGGDLAGPGTRARDDEARRDARQAARALVAQRRRDDPLALALHLHESLVRPRVAAERPRIRDVRLDELPGLHGAVRQLEGAPDGGVQGRLAPQRLGDRDLLAIDVGRGAGRGEGRDVVVGVGRGGDEVAAGILDAGRRDAAEDAVLGDALLRREPVLGHVPAPGVQEAVIPPGGPGPPVAALDEQRAKAPPRQVPEHTGAGRTPADDEDVVGVRLTHAAHLDPSRSPVCAMNPRAAPA